MRSLLFPTATVFASFTLAATLLSGCAAEPYEPEQTEAVEEVVAPKPEADQKEEPPADPEPEEESVTEPERSIDDPTSIWVVSNKHRPLNPIDFEPDDLFFPEGVDNANGQPLRLEAAEAVESLVQAAAADGVYIFMQSAYRPYAMQDNLYNGYIARDGQELADRYSARPGHSEHQTGLVVDFNDNFGCTLNECFEGTPAGLWLQDYGADFGFVMRYPDGYEHITGFMYEPWHYRYVGKDLALDMKAENVFTLEEWFGLDPAPDYL